MHHSPLSTVYHFSFGICDSSIKFFGVAAPQLGQIYLCSMGTYDREQNGQVIGIGSFGTSLMTSFVTSRVSTRVLPPPPRTKISPPPEELLLGEGLDDDVDFFTAAPPTKPPPSPLFCVEGLAEPEDFDDDRDDDFDDDLEDELDPPFIFPSTRNSTAIMTTAASVTNTMMAVKRMARGISYNS